MKAVNKLLLLILVIFLVACGSSQSIKPQPGVTFSGELTQETQGKNSSVAGGNIEFTISDDGESVASISYSLDGDSCWNENKTMTRQGVGYKVTKDPPPPINNGEFVWEDNNINVKAVFSSSTEASGSIAISIKDMSSQLECDYGTWTWDASIQ